jgi:hypothetical protein
MFPKEVQTLCYKYDDFLSFGVFYLFFFLSLDREKDKICVLNSILVLGFVQAIVKACQIDSPRVSLPTAGVEVSKV